MASNNSPEFNSDSEEESHEEVTIIDIGSELHSNDSGVSLSSDQEDESAFSKQMQGPRAMAARAYQLEMLEESLKQNIIVAVGRPIAQESV